jgi:DNA-binding response OmpR family regulator
VSKILIVEDSSTTRALIKVFLVGHNFDYIEAKDGLEGLAMARSQTPDIIIVDLKMPGMDGFTFCRKVRQERRLHKTPVIVLTGTKGEKIAEEALKAGASVFMTKPIDGTALAERIMSYLHDPK